MNDVEITKDVQHISVSGNLEAHQIIELSQKSFKKCWKLTEESTKVKKEREETLQELKQTRKQQRKHSRESLSEAKREDQPVNSEDTEIQGKITSGSEDVETSVAIKKFKKKYKNKLKQQLGLTVPTTLESEHIKNTLKKKLKSTQSKVAKDKKARNKENIAKCSVLPVNQKEQTKFLRVSPIKRNIPKISKHVNSLTKKLPHEEVPVKKRKLA